MTHSSLIFHRIPFKPEERSCSDFQELFYQAFEGGLSTGHLAITGSADPGHPEQWTRVFTQRCKLQVMWERASNFAYSFLIYVLSQVLKHNLSYFFGYVVDIICYSHYICSFVLKKNFFPLDPMCLLYIVLFFPWMEKWRWQNILYPFIVLWIMLSNWT